MTFKYNEIIEEKTFKYSEIAVIEPPTPDPNEEKEIGDIVDISDNTGVDLFTVDQIYPPLSHIIKAIPDPKDVAIKPEEDEIPILVAAPEEEGILQTFLGFKYPPKPPDWKYASLIEKFNYITLPISDFLGRIGGKIATDWRLTTKEKVQTTLAHELADDLKWYQKTPEAIGWTSEKVAEFILLKGIFKVSGLHNVLTTAGQRAAAPFLSKEITARGGIKVVSTLSATGLKNLGRKALTSFLTAAPENAAFIGSWSGLDAAMKGESPEGIAEEVLRGAGWGLGLTAGLSLIAPAVQAPELRMAFGKAMANVGQRYPKLIDKLGKPIAKDIEKEWLKALSKSRGKDLRLIDLSTRERAIFRNTVRAAEREILKVAEKEAAIQAYWASKAVKPPPPIKPPEPVKPTTVQEVVDQAETKIAKVGDLTLDNKGIEEVIKKAEAIIPAPTKPVAGRKAEIAPVAKPEAAKVLDKTISRHYGNIRTFLKDVKGDFTTPNRITYREMADVISKDKGLTVDIKETPIDPSKPLGEMTKSYIVKMDGKELRPIPKEVYDVVLAKPEAVKPKSLVRPERRMLGMNLSKEQAQKLAKQTGGVAEGYGKKWQVWEEKPKRVAKPENRYKGIDTSAKETLLKGIYEQLDVVSDMEVRTRYEELKDSFTKKEKEEFKDITGILDKQIAHDKAKVPTVKPEAVVIAVEGKIPAQEARTELKRLNELWDKIDDTKVADMPELVGRKGTYRTKKEAVTDISAKIKDIRARQEPVLVDLGGGRDIEVVGYGATTYWREAGSEEGFILASPTMRNTIDRAIEAKPEATKIEMPKGIAIAPRFGAIRDLYNRAHDWMFTFGQAKRETPELYDELMSAYGKRNAGVEKAIDQVDRIMPKEIKLDDDVLLAKTYEDKRLSPPENLKEIYDRFARLLDELGKKQLEEGLFAKPFNERMIEENNIRIEKILAENLKHPESSKRIIRLREENDILEQMRYLSHSVVAKRTIESKLNTLTGDKRKAYLTRLSAFYKKRTGKLFLKDYLKAKLITKEDMRMSRLATEEISDYYVRSAYKGLYDYGEAEGYIKPISEGLRKEGWLNQQELGISAPELKDKLVHPILGSALAEMKAMRKGRGTFMSQLFGMVKQGQFIKPTIIYTYNTVQKYMRGMYSFNPVTEAKALVKATRTVLDKDELYHKLNESNLYQFPYEITKAGRDEEIAKFINQHAAEVDKLTKILEKTFDTRWLDPDMTVGRLVRNVIMAAHRAVARLTWSGDKIQRTQSYLILRKMGYPHDEAVKVASKSHGGYSLISEKLKKAASTKLFVYTFRIMMPIEMGKTITEPLIAAKDTMGGAKIPKHQWERMVKAIIGTAFLPFAIDQYMSWRGFEKEGVHLGPLGWKWRKEVEVGGKTREIVVGINYILNMPIKYWQRLTYYNPISKSTRGMQIINNIAKWEIHPVYRIFFWDIRENRRSFGAGISVYDTQANTVVQFGQIAKYIFGQSFRFFGGMMDAVGEGSMTEKERKEQEKIFDAGLNDLDKLLFTALGYKYTRQPINERRVIMQKYLRKELTSRLFEIARKYEGEELEKRKNGLEGWALKCESWIQNEMK